MALKITLLLMAPLLLTSTTDGRVPKKKYNCPSKYRPLCGSNGKTYENYCLLKREVHRTNEKISIKHNGPCKKEEPKKCPSICPLHYMPVCASDGKTYSNKCFMNIASCQGGVKLTVKKFSDCVKKDVKDCNRACPYNYLPVCASNGKLYRNKCLMEMASCESDEKLTEKKIKYCIKSPTRLSIPKEKSGQKQCRGGCPFIYRPVCASNGKTYSNDCVMKYFACKEGVTLEITKNRACGDLILDDDNSRSYLFDFNTFQQQD